MNLPAMVPSPSVPKNRTHFGFGFGFLGKESLKSARPSRSSFVGM